MIIIIIIINWYKYSTELQYWLEEMMTDCVKSQWSDPS